MQTAQIIRDFLDQPLGKRQLGNFYRLCLPIAISKIRRRMSRGWVLPRFREDFGGCVESLAITALNNILETKPDQPFHRVFHYFDTNNLIPHCNVTDEELDTHLHIFLYGQMRNELWKIPGQFDNQLRALYKAIHNTLALEEFVTVTIGGEELIKISPNLSTTVNNSKRIVSQSELHEIVSEADANSVSMPDLLRKVFAALEQRDDLKKVIPRRMLLLTVITVRQSNLEVSMATPEGIDATKIAITRASLLEAAERAFNDTIENELHKHLRNRDYCASEVECIKQALQNYLLDLAVNGETDPRPKYFRELALREWADRYGERYRYVFEALIDYAVESFRDHVKNIPELSDIGDYLHIGGE